MTGRWARRRAAGRPLEPAGSGRSWRAAAILVLVGALSLGVGLVRRAAAVSFSDVPQGSFFETHIDWLTDQGIANGYPNGTFQPTDSITRAQMAFWLGNYNDRLSYATNQVSTFGGVSSISVKAQGPTGKRVLLGGGKSSTSDLFTVGSGPSVSPGGAIDQWEVIWRIDDGGPIPNGVTLDVWALCGPEVVGP